MGISERQAASVAIVRGSEVLLIQRALPPYEGLWTLPGGRSEADETPESTAIREVREELGLVVSHLTALTTMAVSHWQLFVFATSEATGDIVPSHEIAGWRWATLAEAETLNTTPSLAHVLRLIPALA